jgi:hypothetical protein
LSRCWKRRTDYQQNFKAKTLAAVDQFEIDALKKIDDYISRVGLAAPTENIPRLFDGYKEEEVTELNLQGVGISTVGPQSSWLRKHTVRASKIRRCRRFLRL